jgi:hypothetical protein
MLEMCCCYKLMNEWMTDDCFIYLFIMNIYLQDHKNIPDGIVLT